MNKKDLSRLRKEIVGNPAICEDCGGECLCCGESSGYNEKRDTVIRIFNEWGIK